MTNHEILQPLLPPGLGFLAYFVLHSLLASLWLKRQVHRRWPQFTPAYRLGFNVVSIILLIPLLWMMQQNPGPLVWQWPGLWGWGMKLLTVAAILGFIGSLRSYDTQVFLGLTQWRNRHRPGTDDEGSIGNDPEQLHISTLHRFVRHPWYFFLLVIMWTQDLHATQLFTYGLFTLYLVIGSRLEERKLVTHYGAAYQQYRTQVPGLFPLPWRWLGKAEAQRLMQLAAGQKMVYEESREP
ncbi:MAG: hypothetical protein RRB22_06830 [Gammaproteobacteria bacterium]|nr:hypothetical protein [Gammaproteobacteria bacterium]